MFVEQINVGGDRNFGYIVADEFSKLAAIIDPSYSPEKVIKKAKDNGFEIKYIFNTHTHADHTNGNKIAKKITGITPLAYGNTNVELGIRIEDGAVLMLGNLEIKILHTPGHTEDCICIYTGDAVFTGDTLFVGKVGGTDLGSQAKSEYESLHDKLLKLPDESRVFPGHDYGTAKSSTIKNEKQTNPFLLRTDFGSFVELKKNWAEYKAIHGIK